jgi:hypothetical protein
MSAIICGIRLVANFLFVKLATIFDIDALALKGPDRGW